MRPTPHWLTPVLVAFAGSLILSFVAWLGSGINRDGMLYINTAQAFLEGGFTAAKASFAWPFLSIGIAIISRLTGLGLEHAGYLLNAFFMAGTCALMIACIERRTPELAWWSCLIVLALPGLNEYRNELLREYGCWFFIMLAFWLALRWAERPSWFTALPPQLALSAAALFRPEALALFPALIAWQLFAAPRGERWQRVAMLGILPLLGGSVLLMLFLGGQLGAGNRLAVDFGRLNVARFDAKAQALAAALIDYAQNQARTILLFGSLALIPIKLINKFGLFLAPLAFLFVARELRTSATRYPLFIWGIGAHLLVLAVFVTDLQFLAGRYVGLILLFSTPFVAAGMALIAARYHRLRWLLLVLTIAIMLANVISLGQGKTHFVDAGHWLSSNAQESSRVYIDSGRTAYHAGWRKIPVQRERNNRSEIEKPETQARFDLFVLEVSRKDAPIDDWLASSGLRIVKRFDHPNRDAVLVVQPTTATEQAPK
ncbi:MAG: hypothetical protein H6943_03000 [Zoogloeaceae bacterium]|nr:hypothetical protein [Zoogloeaceae bacterium]